MVRRETGNGDLRTPVVFYAAQLREGLDGREMAYERVFMTFAEVYNPSMKDVELLRNQNIQGGKGIRMGVTIKIRDPLSSFFPDTTHFVELIDQRWAGRKWEVVAVRPSFDERQFLTVVLGGGSDG